MQFNKQPKTNISKIIYYGVAQNIIFTALQQAMFGMLFTDDDDLEDLGPKEKKFRNCKRWSFKNVLSYSTNRKRIKYKKYFP